MDARSVVVDDANTDRITYSSGWKEFNDCTCLVQPTKASANNGTYHPCVVGPYAHPVLTSRL
jgi:hypothetical protein